MRNFISEDDIEQAILSKLKAEPFEYDILICDADPSKRDDLNDGTGRNSKKECVLPDVMLSSLKRINPTIEEDKIKEIVKTLRQDYTGTDIVDTNYKLYRQIRNNIKITVRRNGKEDFDFVKLIDFEHPKNKTKKYPVLSTRDDIIVLVDEAHRTQYKNLAENMRTALPNANFIAFTGTPLLGTKRLTNQWFGDYVSEYNFAQSVEDGSTVPLFYSRRVPEVGLIMSLTEYYVEKRKAMEEAYHFDLLNDGKGNFAVCVSKVVDLNKLFFAAKDVKAHGYVNTLVYQTAFDEIESELEKFRCKIYKTKYVPVKSSPISGMMRYFGEDSETKGTDE